MLLEEETETDGIKYMVGHTTRYVKVFLPMTEGEMQPNETVNVKVLNVCTGDGIEAERIG